jgi:hypothetical protein
VRCSGTRGSRDGRSACGGQGRGGGGRLAVLRERAARRTPSRAASDGPSSTTPPGARVSSPDHPYPGTRRGRGARGGANPEPPTCEVFRNPRLTGRAERLPGRPGPAAAAGSPYSVSERRDERRRAQPRMVPHPPPDLAHELRRLTTTGTAPRWWVHLPSGGFLSVIPGGEPTTRWVYPNTVQLGGLKSRGCELAARLFAVTISPRSGRNVPPGGQARATQTQARAATVMNHRQLGRTYIRLL